MPAAKAAPVKPKTAKSGKDELSSISNLRSDMDEEMQREAIAAAREAMAESKDQKSIAAAVKQRFDAAYPGSTWHAIVGTHFASSITHATRCLVFFNLNGQNILLFRSIE